MPALLLLLLVVSMPAASAQVVRLHVPSDSVYVGERFTVSITLDRQPGAQVILPEPPRGAALVDAPLVAGDAELLTLRRFPPTTHGVSRRDSVVYEATVFALDSARVGPLALRLVVGGDTAVVASPTAIVGVRSTAPVDAAELRGPTPPAAFPATRWPWLLALIGLALLALAVLLLRRRRRPRQGPDPRLPPAVEARRRLDALTPDPRRADLLAYYVELSDTLRTYLGRTLHVPAREVTSDELLAALDGHQQDVPPEAREAVRAVLVRSDLVKFAGAAPPSEAQAEAVRQARQAVDAIETERIARVEAERAAAAHERAAARS